MCNNGYALYSDVSTTVGPLLWGRRMTRNGGFSDDSKSSRTAGKPMLAQMMGSEIGEITAVTVRYYGGTPLGTGKLVKAYGGGVQQALK
ncbi:MAG: YigZ family protein [Candidatus Malihini olakiniferum]